MVWHVERLSKEAAEPVHGELIHVIEHLQVLHSEVQSGTLLCSSFELLAELANLVLSVLSLLQLLLDLTSRFLRLIECLDEAI